MAMQLLWIISQLGLMFIHLWTKDRLIVKR